MLRLATATLLAGVAALSDPSDVQPSCSETGVAYEDQEKSSLPNGAYLVSSMMCQQSCGLNPYCKKFTWKRNSEPMGACYLIMDEDAKATEEIGAVSGPKACPLPKTAFAPAVKANRPGAPELEVTRDANVEGKAQGQTLVAGDSGMDGHQGLTMGLIGACIAGIGLAGAGYYFLGSKEKAKRAVTVKTPDEEVPMVAATDAPAAPAAAANQAVFVQGTPLVYHGQTVQMTPVPQYYVRTPMMPMEQTYVVEGTQYRQQ